jgi:hypothetical protein
MELIHPEKRAEIVKGHTLKLREMWLKIVNGRELEDIPEFQEALLEYVKQVRQYMSKYSDARPDIHLDLDKFTEKLKSTPLWQRVVIKLEYPYIVMDWLTEQVGVPSFPLLGVEPRMDYIQSMVALDAVEGVPAPMNPEARMTEFVVRHAHFWFSKYGKKAYRVSPGLQWMLENTELRRYPCDDLRLPFPVIYLSLPPKYLVFNEVTGWHTSEGMYIVEDCNTIPRCWRLILAAKPNEKSVDEYDDAIYHWLIHFKEGTTVEESIQESIDVVYKQHAAGEYERILIMRDGSRKTFASSIPVNLVEGRRLEIFEDMQKTMLPLFRYVMNVVLYSTLPDADAVFSDASPEYAALRRRASHEKNERKRKELNSRASAIGPHPRIILGGSITVSRETKEAQEEGTGDGSRRQKVRSLVTGHWHRFWTGPRKEQDKRNLVKKWVQPYWRGPEAAPLTEKEHHLV